jgi:OmpA-OmpF porin, OOP family
MSPKSVQRTLFLPLLVVVLAAAAAPAVAQDRPFYVAASVGRTSVNDLEGASIDESTTGFRLATGYRFSKWFGVGGGYVDLGTIKSSVDIGGGATTPVKASADGFEVTVSGRVPLTEALALTAHAGILWWAGDTSVGGATASDSGNDPTWGVGVEYAFGPAFVGTAGWRRYSVDDVDANTVWLGAMVRFGEAD